MLKKNWELCRATEHIYGTTIKRWYLKSPLNNYYFIFRSDYGGDCGIYMSLGPELYDYTCLRAKTGERILTFNDAMKLIYDLDSRGEYKVEVNAWAKKMFERMRGF